MGGEKMYSIIYITTSGVSESNEIAKVLLQERLAACVNIVPSITSMYLWKGAIEEDNESLMIVKTKSELFEKIIIRVKEIHSYEIPCILKINVEMGSQSYLDWINSELD